MVRQVFPAFLVFGLVNLAGCGGTTDPPVAATVMLSPTTLSFSSFGETQQLTPTVADQNGATISDASVTWESSSSSVASVSSVGLVAAVANGTATITATSGSSSGTATVTVVTEMIDLAGTWSIQSWVITQVAAPNATIDLFDVRTATNGELNIEEATFYFYDDGTILEEIFYADTLDTATQLITLAVDSVSYEIDTYCVSLAAADEFCANAGDGEMIFDENGEPLTFDFVRTGDDMTISGDNPEDVDFGTGDEAATFVMTLERIIPVDDRPPIV